ncbi:MAG: PilZ domain-containing protein [Candidatus Omnitrophota bacterium]|jgi:hypothetical protein
MPKEGFTEKRKFVRFLISIPLKYAKVGIKQIASVITRDISAEGMGLITTEEVPVNAPLSVCLTIPDNGEEIPLDAEVCWSRKDGQGKYHSGLKLKRSRIKPIPLVLRTVNSRL